MVRPRREPTGSLAALFSNGLRLLGGQGGLVAVGFLQTMLATRLLGTDRFGAWALLTSISTLTGVFLSFRTSEALTSFWVEAESGGHTDQQAALFSAAFYAELFTKGLAAVVLLAVAPAVLAASNVRISVRGAIACSALALLLSVFDPLWFSLLRHRRRIMALAVLPIVLALLRLLLSAALVLIQGPSVLAFAEALLLAQVASTLLKGAAIRDLYGVLTGSGGLILPLVRSVRLRRSQSAFWRMMSAGYLSSCLSSLTKEADGLVIGLVAGAREVGFYRLAKSLVGLIQTAAQTLATLLMQDFAELLARRDPAALRSFVIRIGLLSAVVAALGSALLFVLVAPMLALLFGRRYLPAVAPFRILVVGAAVSSALAWASPLLTALRRMKTIVVLNLLTFGVFAVSLAIAVPLAGGLGPAFAVACSLAIGHLAALWAVRSVFAPPARRRPRA